VDFNGNPYLTLNNAVNNNLFIVIHHRNHLSVISSVPVPLSGTLYEYDFTVSETTVYGGSTGYNNLGPGIWGMSGGDGNCDGEINLLDKGPAWEQQAGEEGYNLNDHNMDGQADNQDKDDYLLPNIGKVCQVPE
jgi:hypothetical protein